MKEVEALARRKGWLEGKAGFTTERPFVVDVPAIPHYTLLSPEGRIVRMGSAVADQEEIRAFLVREGRR